MIDSRDVEEVVLVVVGEKTFHLCRVHAAVRLSDIDSGIADLRKDIDRHALDREYRSQRDRDQSDDDCQRTTERKQNETHR